jgi:hypothetical protein
MVSKPTRRTINRLHHHRKKGHKGSIAYKDTISSDRKNGLLHMVEFTPYLLGTWGGGIEMLPNLQLQESNCKALCSIKNVMMEKLAKISKYSLRICAHKNNPVVCTFCTV